MSMSHMECILPMPGYSIDMVNALHNKEKEYEKENHSLDH